MQSNKASECVYQSQSELAFYYSAFDYEWAVLDLAVLLSSWMQEGPSPLAMASGHVHWPWLL